MTRIGFILRLGTQVVIRDEPKLFIGFSMQRNVNRIWFLQASGMQEIRYYEADFREVHFGYCCT